MYYKKIETYSYSMPQEHSAYLKFKDDLQEAGIPFTEEGGNLRQTIQIVITHRFDPNEVQV